MIRDADASVHIVTGAGGNVESMSPRQEGFAATPLPFSIVSKFSQCGRNVNVLSTASPRFVHNSYSDLALNFSQYRSLNCGFNRMVIHNDSHMHWTFVPADHAKDQGGSGGLDVANQNKAPPLKMIELCKRLHQSTTNCQFKQFSRPKRRRASTNRL